jgi:nucleoside-diphosphate-sugar epimerase
MTSQTSGVCAVTGASGYVGSIIIHELQKHMPVVAMVRHPKSGADIAWSLESGQDIAKTLRARNVKTLVHVLQTSSMRPPVLELNVSSLFRP